MAIGPSSSARAADCDDHDPYVNQTAPTNGDLGASLALDAAADKPGWAPMICEDAQNLVRERG